MTDAEKLLLFEVALNKIIAILEHPEVECPELQKNKAAQLTYVWQTAYEAINGTPKWYGG